jgi:hypothetical protein
MIWFDIAVTLLLTLRMVLFGLKMPHLLRPENDLTSLVGNRGEEESLLVAEGEMDQSLQRSESGLHNTGVMQLHIHVMPDLKAPR